MLSANDILPPNDVIESVTLCMQMTKNYDMSHDLTHHIAVLNNALKIIAFSPEINVLPLERIKEIAKIVYYVCMFHDTVDKKYPNTIVENSKILNELLASKFINWEDIRWIIDNMSYTSESLYGYPIHSSEMIQLARNICSDADKLEAIGAIGIERCFIFNRIKKPEISNTELRELIVKHCHEKLLTLKDNYFRTSHGRELAIPLHEYIENFVAK